MSASEHVHDEIRRLLWAMRDGELLPDDARKLCAMLRDDPQARELYVWYMFLSGSLEWDQSAKVKRDSGFRVQGSRTDVGSAVQLPNHLGEISNLQSPIPSPAPLVPPIILDLSPTSHDSSFTSLVSPGGFLFSYTMSAAILGIGLLIGWAWRVSYYQPQIAGRASQPAPRTLEPETPPVGRVTGTADCRWADLQTAAADGDSVCLGRRYVLAAGLMEITYGNGARVILEGPATFQVESAGGGYLSVGKLTARVESRESRVESQGRRGDRSPLSTLDSQLFSVRTPTALVVDLGTEFGVEVDQSGTTRSYVFRGRVQLRPTRGGKETGRVIPLEEDDSASVQAAQDRTVEVTRGASRSSTLGFVREMPRPIRIMLFSTGIGLSEGQPDPHWQIVARSDDPAFRPRSALVTGVPPRDYLPNDPLQSQWITAEIRYLPGGTYTFRTTFELPAIPSEGGMLRGRFLADNHVAAMRLNGRAVPVPQHDGDPPFNRFFPFTIREGFVRGTNVLEVDVRNRASSSHRDTPMALRLEFEGCRASRQPPFPVLPPDVPTTNHGKETYQR
jgi:hypothetical protein